MPAGALLRHLLFWIVIAALTIAYCWPGHPSAGSRVGLDTILHVGLFATLGLVFGFAPDSRVQRLVFLGLLAAALEVGQWLIGDFRQVEITDILSNEAGVIAAALFYWMLGGSARRTSASTLPEKRTLRSGQSGP